MPNGTLEVLLISAKGLADTDYINKMDPYVVLSCRSKEEKSSVASGKGGNPEWNETFRFNLAGDVTELRLKIMDKDTFTADDVVGEATIPLETVFREGNVPATTYHVVKDEKYKGEVRVSLTFRPEERRSGWYEGGGGNSGGYDAEGNRGGYDAAGNRGGYGDGGSRGYDAGGNRGGYDVGGSRGYEAGGNRGGYDAGGNRGGYGGGGNREGYDAGGSRGYGAEGSYGGWKQSEKDHY